MVFHVCVFRTVAIWIRTSLLLPLLPLLLLVHPSAEALSSTPTPRPTTATTITPTATTAQSAPLSRQHVDLAIIGGGTSGTLAAIGALRNAPTSAGTRIALLESTETILRDLRSNQDQGMISRDPLRKVSEVLKEGFPRGRRELAGLLTKTWSPRQQQEWLTEYVPGVVLETPTQHGVTIVRSRQQEEDNPESSFGASTQPLADALADMLDASADNADGSTEDVEDGDTSTKLQVLTNSKVIAIDQLDDGDFILQIGEEPHDSIRAYAVVLATGSSHSGLQLACSLGHSIVEPIPCGYPLVLNAENQTTAILDDIDSFQSVDCTMPFVRLTLKVQIAGQKRPRTFKQEGSLTFVVVPYERDGDSDNSGDDGDDDGNIDDDDDDEHPMSVVMLTGEAVQRLTSFAAQELHDQLGKEDAHQSTHAELYVHFCPELSAVERVESELWQYRLDHPKQPVMDTPCPLIYRKINYDEYDWETESFAVTQTACVPSVVWNGLASSLCNPNAKWGNLSPKKIRALADMMVGCRLQLDLSPPSTTGVTHNAGPGAGGAGRSTMGGIRLSEINFNNMESKVCPGLFVCGSAMDATGCSDGYSFLMDFATGYSAGENAVQWSPSDDG